MVEKMKQVEKMTNGEFVEYLSELISKYKKENEMDLSPVLERAYSIIKENYRLSIDLKNTIEIKKGKRVSICYDGLYYFLLPKNNGKPFAPSLKKEELLEIFEDIESNV